MYLMQYEFELKKLKKVIKEKGEMDLENLLKKLDELIVEGN